MMGIQPRVKSLRSSYTGLYPPKNGLTDPQACTLKWLAPQPTFLKIAQTPRRYSAFTGVLQYTLDEKKVPEMEELQVMTPPRGRSRKCCMYVLCGPGSGRARLEGERAPRVGISSTVFGVRVEGPVWCSVTTQFCIEDVHVHCGRLRGEIDRPFQN